MSTAVEYDPLSPEMLANPYPQYARFRRTAPIFWHEGMKSWVLSRYQDCRDVLRDNDTFARDRRRVGAELPEFLQNIQTIDPPDQGPLKSVLMNALRSQDLDTAGAQAREQITGIFADLARRERFDWIKEVAAPVALTITSHLFGVQRPDLQWYVKLSDSIARRMDIGLRPERAAVGNDARTQLNSLVDQWYAAERRPGVFATIRETAGQLQVPPHYVHNTAGVMFNASYGTLFATVSNIALTLIERPETLNALRGADRKLLDSATDELIRFEGPAQGTSRVATERTVIHGTTIERGQIVLTLMASANRDETEFTRPDELVLDRSPNRHLSFGWGVHGCLGAAFGRVAVRELILCLTEAPRLRLAGTPVRRTTATVRSLDSLPVSFTA
ncbi:cytochrome P450 [Micromonospora arida]|uniref:Cytochrome P450 n=1 Tax=Micromonospora arida TaxID=2203715 RepID=A0A3N9WKW9_9ACTN|nr:cytochrome P450 [Micromonospora arida]